jgi:hypothetical protein
MAWKFDQAIVRGELDNTEQGRVQVRLEILGRKEPLLFDLAGDAWQDIAGSRLRFSNPTPKRQFKIPTTAGVQAGWVGDITASRKVKVFTVPEEEWRQAYREGNIDSMPTEMRNSLYLEWFTVEHGRCVVESADFEIEVIEHSWQMRMMRPRKNWPTCTPCVNTSPASFSVLPSLKTANTMTNCARKTSQRRNGRSN